MKTYEEDSVYKELSTVKEISIDEELSIDKEISIHRELSIGKEVTIAGELRHRLLVVSGAVALTFIFFLMLPLLQAITKQSPADLLLQTVDTANVPPPPPPLEAVPEKEPEPQEKPPELMEAAPPLDLAQLEVALNPNLWASEGWTAGDFVVKLNTVASGGAGTPQHLIEVFQKAHADAAIVASMVHTGEYTIAQIKQELETKTASSDQTAIKTHLKEVVETIEENEEQLSQIESKLTTDQQQKLQQIRDELNTIQNEAESAVKDPGEDKTEGILDFPKDLTPQLSASP